MFNDKSLPYWAYLQSNIRTVIFKAASFIFKLFEAVNHTDLFVVPVNYPRGRSYNWLAFANMNRLILPAFRTHARGILVDIGCGEKPYKAFLSEYVDKHIGVDHPSTVHGKDQIDIFASAYDTTLASESADTVISTCVLEHLEESDMAVREMHRILKPGGKVILTAPFFWLMHENPRDFYRFTRYGLEHLFKKAGFKVISITPSNGWPSTCAVMSSYMLHYLAGDILDRIFTNRKSLIARIAGSPVLIGLLIIQCLGYVFDRIIKFDFDFYTSNFLIIAEK